MCAAFLPRGWGAPPGRGEDPIFDVDEQTSANSAGVMFQQGRFGEFSI